MSHAINTKSLQRLVTTVQELSMARDITTVMTIVRKVARELTGADGATFVLRDRLSEGEFCYYADEDAIGPLWKGSRFPIEACISGHAMINRKPIVIEDIYTDDRIPIAAYEVTFVKSLAMVPIRTIDPVGAIGNYWAHQHLATEEEVSLLQSLADITAVTIENIKVYDELEQRVKQRTLELEEKNQEILKSITYAKRIQRAILPPVHSIRENLENSFVLYKPKDIVAGDFYWMERKDDLIFIAAGDCTGHGVPGAIVSVICSSALNRSVNEFGLTDTGKILDKARELVLDTFAKSDEEIKDGMDISLCSINVKDNTVCWSGANNNLVYIHKEEMQEIKAHKQPIGKTDEPTPFPTHQLALEKGDKLYLITDGFADQFGGEKGKKYKRNHLEEFITSIQHNPLQTQGRELETTFENWKKGLEQVDDVTIIGIGL